LREIPAVTLLNRKSAEPSSFEPSGDAHVEQRSALCPALSRSDGGHIATVR